MMDLLTGEQLTGERRRRFSKWLRTGRMPTPIVDAVGGYEGKMFGEVGNTTSAATVGSLVLRANGVLTIERDGGYRFDGRLSADPDKYDFNKRLGRSAVGEASTTIGRQLPGKPFLLHLIGSKPFSVRGRR